METFITDNFMLQNKIAEELYHEHASRMPIIDFHSHLPPENIADNSAYPSLTDVWLGGDHYKWRAMRSDGVDEQHITGQSSDWEKFQAWAQTVPHTIGNPLYHWTHLELLRYFKIDKLLNPASAAEIYDAANGYLLQKDFRVRPLLEKMQVEVICTTDDPVDSLEHHQKIAEDSLNSLKVVPTFRPDRTLAAENPADFNAYLDTLGEKAGFEIDDYDTFIEALEKRHAFFHDNGCRSSDHALVSPIAENFTLSEVKSIFKKVRNKTPLDALELRKLQTAALVELGKMNFKRAWVMQLHIGAIRNNNSLMFERLGPDTGFDSMGDRPYAQELVKFLDILNADKSLPKTVVYNLNPRDYEMIMSIIGSFQAGTIPGKIQLGSAWWFNDQKNGMERQMKSVADMGLLYRFIGMLTDSRSFLSFPRHEYFRRILSNLIGSWVVQGEAPHDMELLGEMVRRISYSNAKEYFEL